MMLVELGSVPSEALPIAELKEHIRLGSGFGDDAAQDALLEAYLRSAISAIETRIGKAIFQRPFSWTVTRWSDCARLGLPIAPVASVTALRVVAADGSETVIDPARYVVQADSQRPGIQAAGTTLPSIPANGHAEIEFEAGYGLAWEDAPAALRHAILVQTAHFYECREGCGDKVEVPMAVQALIAGFRPVRIGGARV